MGSNWSLCSRGSRVSGYTVASESGLSEREVKQMRRLMNERERRERENNIVIKGMQV